MILPQSPQAVCLSNHLLKFKSMQGMSPKSAFIRSARPSIIIDQVSKAAIELRDPSQECGISIERVCYSLGSSELICMILSFTHVSFKQIQKFYSGHRICVCHAGGNIPKQGIATLLKVSPNWRLIVGSLHVVFLLSCIHRNAANRSGDSK